MPHTESIMLLAGALLALAILATRLSLRLGVPALILFVATGMLAGSDGPGGIWFDDPAFVWSFAMGALALLLFASGLDTPAAHIRPVLAPGLVLASVGVAVSTVATAAFYTLAFDRPLAEGLLLGAIVSSTDTAAVFGVLRSAGLRLRGRIQPLLELESGSNDPMAIFLTLAATAALTGAEWSALGVATGFVVQMSLGLAGGYLGGRLLVWAVNRLRVGQEGLYPVFTSAGALVVFGATALAHGSGFLAVYVAGIVVGARPLVHRRAIVRFHDALAWLAQIAMFLLLGLQVFPSQLPAVAERGLGVALFLLLVARPLSVVVSLTPFGVPLREQAMVAWVGLRGAVPIVLATWPLSQRAPGAQDLFDVVFFVVLLSVLVQGVTLSWVARWLGVADPEPAGGAADPEAIGEARGAAVVPVVVGAAAHGRPLLELGLPPGALVVLVARGAERLVPQGATVLQAGDVAQVMLLPEQEPEVRRKLGGAG